MTELFAVLDMAAERYNDPFPAPTVAMALREFTRACQNPELDLHKFPEDYALYHIGTFDPTLGEITPLIPHKIANAGTIAINSKVPTVEQIDLEHQLHMTHKEA